MLGTYRLRNDCLSKLAEFTNHIRLKESNTVLTHCLSELLLYIEKQDALLLTSLWIL